MIEIQYKYRIGDKVKIEHLCTQNYYINKDILVGKTVTIKARGFEYCPVYTFNGHSYDKETRIKTFYYIEEEKSVCPTRWDEENFSGVINPEIVKYSFKSYDNYEINAGDKIYCVLIRKKYDDNSIEANTKFTFSGQYEVIGFRCNHYLYDSDLRNINSEITPKLEILGSRTFLCYYPPDKGETEPRPCRDSRAYGCERWSSLKNEYILKELPNNYPQLFIDTCKEKHDKYPLGNCDIEKFDIKMWLEHFGIYDEIVKLCNEEFNSNSSKDKSIKKKTSRRKLSDKVSEMLKGLSDEEKKEILKQLNVEENINH